MAVSANTCTGTLSAPVTMKMLRAADALHRLFRTACLGQDSEASTKSQVVYT